MGSLDLLWPGNAYRIQLHETIEIIDLQDARIVEGSFTSHNWDCKNSVVEFDLSVKIVIFDDTLQTKILFLT